MAVDKLQFVKASPEVLHIVRRHLKDLTILIESGVFELQNGKAVIHKDNDGNIRKIEIENIAFKT